MVVNCFRFLGRNSALRHFGNLRRFDRNLRPKVTPAWLEMTDGL